MGDNIDRSWIKKDSPVTDPASQQQGDAPKAVAPPKDSVWQVDALPPGFRKITEIRRIMHRRAEPAIQIVFSDGLAGISVFIETTDNDEDDHPGLASQGAIQIYSKVIDDHLVTVVGEVPPQTIIQVGDSIRYAGE